MKMFRRSFWGSVGLGVLVVSLGMADSASAWWRSHGSSGGSWGSSGGSWGSSGGSWGSSGGSWGSSGGSWGSSGGSWGSSGGSWGSGGGYYGVPYASASAAPQSNVAYLNVKVPADARVYLQDQRMTIGGTQRRFVTPELEQGKSHVYTVKVEVERGGKTLSKVAKATVVAGQEVEVVVNFDERAPGQVVASAMAGGGR